jgi:4-hydroxybutyrate dehydrogenase
MKQFRISPKIVMCETAREFCEAFKPDANDLVFMGRSSARAFEGLLNGTHVIYRSDYGTGEPTDVMVERIRDDVKDIPYKRVIAIGGGTIVDAAKLLALKEYHPVLDLFDKKIPAVRDKGLVIVPTTCGTGSEVTNISILELTARATKLGLADDALFADSAVLIPELLEGLPYEVFATSSIDALVHATESYLSPKATPFSRDCSLKAVSMILEGYLAIRDSGATARFPYMERFLLASTYAGLAFGNAGTGAVHAMSYSFGAKYHVPHGEANYALFSGVFKTYQKIAPDGDIESLNRVIASYLKCDIADTWNALESLLGTILPLKPLRAYGVTESDLAAFTENTMTKQGRLTANNYRPLSTEQVLTIYRSAY